MMKAAFVGAALAASLSLAHASEAVLTVTDGKQTLQLGTAQLAQLRQDAIETKTAWTQGETTFAGPAFTDVLNKAGFNGDTVTAESADGHAVAIPRTKLTSDGAILALTMNGAPLPPDRGPFWIIFPYDRSADLKDKQHELWSASSVTKLTVR